MKKIISIHQPNFFPWLPTLVKEAAADVFIVFDHVEFSKNGWTNRCRYSTGNNDAYLTLPVKKIDTSLPINQVRIGGSERDYKKISKTFAMLSNKLPGKKIVEEIWKNVEKEITPGSSLSNANILINRQINKLLKIQTERLYSSNDRQIKNLRKSDLVEEVVNKHNGGVYLTGEGGMMYLKKEFQNKCILVNPKALGLLPHEINAIDFICHHGENSLKRFENIVENFRKEHLDEL